MVSVAGRQLARPVVLSFATRAEMGQAAAADVAADLRARLARQSGVRMIFAAAVSQSDMLEALIAAPGIDWRRVTAFHMDEYLDLQADAPQRFGNWLRRAIFDRLPFAAVNLIDPGRDAKGAVRAYAARLAEAPIDMVCLGIGVNGHLAFNDPPVADFADPEAVKIVTLDDVCRQQQVDDGAFTTVTDVPRRAVTLTIPRLLAAERLFCVVPGASKREAVARALEGPLETACPASALRLHPDCRLYLDAESDPRR